MFLGVFSQKQKSQLTQKKNEFLSETDSNASNIVDPRKDLGQYGEQLVVDYLQDRGFKILAKNYQQRFGEIDIIAQKSELVVFVEVKLRNNIYFNNSEIINYSKKLKIIKTAKYFAATHSIVDKILRFDVAIVEKYFNDFSINYIENAFCSGE